MKVVIVGHIDHGKSTLIGRLLYDSGSLPESRLSEMQSMAEEYKKKFEFSSFMDAFADEIKEERTIDTTEVFFKGKYLHTLIDVPGHKEFIEAMLTGASHAEAAIVVVDVTKGLEEQTKRHLNLIRLLGITDIVVAINKMDLASYHWNNFELTSQEISEFTDKLGYRGQTIIPISASEGDNIYTRSSKYGEADISSVVEALDLRESIKKQRETPTRFVVQGIHKDKVLGSGNIGLNEVTCWSPIKSPKRGCVGSTSELKVASKIWAKVFVLDKKISESSTFSFKCGTARVYCTVLSINRRIDSETGEDIELGDLKKHNLGVVVLGLEPIVVDKFEDYPPLGRFTLNKNGRDVAIGVVLDYE